MIAYGRRVKLIHKSWFQLLKRQYLLSRPAVALLTLLLGLSISLTPAHAASHPKAHVYLIRGLLNVFSLGMDEIAAKLRQQGIPASVSNHLLWPLVAAEAAQNYRSGRARTIILVGHSAGTDAVANIAARLGEQGIPVKLVINLDPGLSVMPASGHVDRYINYYVPTGIGHSIAKGAQFRGHLENINVANIRGVGHFNIDKNVTMEARVIRDIRSAF